VSLKKVSLVKLILDGCGGVVSGAMLIRLKCVFRAVLFRVPSRVPVEWNTQGEGQTVSQETLSETLAIAIEFGSDGVGYESGNSDNRTIN
jgi:hypothetical protein